MATTGKRKRVSKNKKRNWRKHTDIKDVEKYLDQKRFEERTGGPASSKTDSDLFFEDKQQIKDSERKNVQEKGKKRVLRCFQHLQPSAWPEPFIKPNRTKTPEERQKSLITKRAKKQKTNKDEPLDKLSKPTVHMISSTWSPQFDLWQQEDEPEVVLDKDLKNYYLEQTKKKQLKVPEFRYQKPSALPAVVVPCPGASYNPAYEDYCKLITDANSIEEKKQKERERIDRAFPKKILRSTQSIWLEEMSQGIFEEPESNSEEETEVDIPTNPPVRATDRKPKQKRNREIKVKLLQKEIEQQKLKRRLDSDFFRLKSLKAEIKAENVKSEEVQKKRQIKQIAKLSQPAKTGPYPFVAPDVEVLLPDELSGSLREIKPQGSLIEDRVKSFQSRNIIEPRVRQKKYRKYALKRYVKKSHK